MFFTAIPKISVAAMASSTSDTAIEMAQTALNTLKDIKYSWSERVSTDASTVGGLSRDKSPGGVLSC